MIITKTFPVRKSFNNVFDDLFGTLQNNAGLETKNNVPVNIINGDNSFQLAFSAPGRSKEDFKISVDDQILTVSFEQKADTTADTNEKFVRKEFVNGSFKRLFTIDEKIDAERIEARYENGILVVTLPKKEIVKDSPRHISIQ